MPSELGNLTNLQTLERFVKSHKNSINRKDVGRGADELNCLNNLKGWFELVLGSDFKYGWATNKLVSYITGAANQAGEREVCCFVHNPV